MMSVSYPFSPHAPLEGSRIPNPFPLAGEG
jgi:hypothetical protein